MLEDKLSVNQEQLKIIILHIYCCKLQLIRNEQLNEVENISEGINNSIQRLTSISVFVSINFLY